MSDSLTLLDCSLPDSFVHGILGKLKVKVAQLCPTLCDPMDLDLEILQALILE